MSSLKAEVAMLRAQMAVIEQRLAAVEAYRMRRRNRGAVSATFMLGSELRRARLLAGWSCRALGDAMGVTEHSVRAWEDCKSTLTYARAAEIVAIFQQAGADAPAILSESITLGQARGMQ